MSDAHEVAVSVSQLSKCYPRYARRRDWVLEFLTGRPRHTECWALKNVSFEVKQGGVVGVLGRNGAGKSTLLRTLAGTLAPTAGRVVVRGRLSAILELGIGFHPDYTGRENVYIGGLCLGLSRGEIAGKFRSIVEFAQLEDVIDQPLRTYSTGMKARLAFATAMSVEPDVLIVDEALSVGDALFADRCFERVRQIVRKGATVLLVSHYLPTIYEHCTSALLLHQGSLLQHGEPRAVGYAYEQLLAQERAALHGLGCVTTVRGAEAAEEPLPDTYIESVSVVDEQGRPASVLEHRRRYAIRVVCFSRKAVDAISLGFRIQKPGGGIVYGTTTLAQRLPLSIAEWERVTVDFDWTCWLASGSYVVGAGVAQLFDRDRFAVLHMLRDTCVVEVQSDGSFQGDVDMQSRATVRERVSLRGRA